MVPLHAALLPWTTGINVGVLYPDVEDVTRCPKCGEADTLKANGWHTADVQQYGLLTCSSCKSHARNSHVKRRVNVRGVS